CGLGQTAPNPVLTTLKYFRKEYEEHIFEHRCGAKECSAMLRYEINPEKCRGCTICAKNCPAKAISGEVKKAHIIDKDLCIKCGACSKVCRFGAVEIF
ncbi:MAG: 4Fe-4S binding protein, partial [Oscillospiraceae bacterium]|nr:4Fe-4S binding protein [Oscillospiraceae bacterium]